MFIQASDKKDRTGGGREQVKDWGTKLPSAGLKDVLGLIDRDEANASTDRVKVLKRYSLENFLLDPIIVYAVLMNDGVHEKILNLGIPDNNYFNLQKLAEDQLQLIADTLCGIVEAHYSDVRKFGGKFEVQYVSGKKVQLPQWIKDCRGHDLEAFYREAFKKEIVKNYVLTRDECGELVKMLTERLPHFIPVELLETLQELQESKNTGV